MNSPQRNCKYYGSMVGCRHGNNCRYSHLNPNSVPFCHYYNNCQFGKTCKFRHIDFSSDQQSICKPVIYQNYSYPVELPVIMPSNMGFLSNWFQKLVPEFVETDGDVDLSTFIDDDGNYLDENKINEILHDIREAIDDESVMVPLLPINENDILPSPVPTLNFKQYSHDLSHCVHFSRFILIMQRYNTFHIKNVNKLDDINILQTLNDYMHLIHKHSTDEQFEFIVNKLGDCDIDKCSIFVRNIQNRNDNSDDSPISDKKNEIDSCHKILDKMHCFFSHCYDIGNRLLSKEKILIDNENLQVKINNENDLFDNNLINTQVKTITKILASRRSKICGNISNKINSRMNKKYNQIFESKKEDDDCKMYSFGLEFKYEYENEFMGSYQFDLSTSTSTYVPGLPEIRSIPVFAKYSSLKEELLSNAISRLSIKQFALQYNIAEIHFNSDFCKQKFRPLSRTYAGNCPCGRCRTIEASIEIQNILSLMIYCNYDDLQYEFSKTYRQHNGNAHNNFYNLGKCLRITISTFGATEEDEDVKAFYHGIAEHLSFPGFLDLEIQCPLSTSSDFAVAVNFTNQNNGLIVEFGSKQIKPRFFSVAWLSDYANESEYLFIRERHLEIVNIFDAKFGYEYCDVLKVFKIVQNQRYFPNGTSSKIKKLTSKMFENRLRAKVFPDKYMNKMIETYFTKQKQLQLDYCQMTKEKYLFLRDLFFQTEYQWIKLKEISLLFPNIERIDVYNVGLCSSSMNNILDHLINANNKSKLNLILIHTIENNDLDVLSAISAYEQKFKKINFRIFSSDLDVDNKNLWIDKNV